LNFLARAAPQAQRERATQVLPLHGLRLTVLRLAFILETS